MRQQEFRHSVLALMLVSDHFCAAASTMLAPRFFEQPAEQHLCRFILEHFREYHQAPRKMAVRERAMAYFNGSKHLQNDAKEFDLVLDIAVDLDGEVAKQSEYIQNHVREFCREQAMKDALLKSIDDIKQGKFELVSERVQKALSVGAEMDGRGIYLLQDADTRQTMEEVRSCVATGHRWLDEPTKGGVARGELAIIMAAPNTGKTTGLINAGVGGLKKRNKVAHFSLEMKKEIVRVKYDQCLTKKTDGQLSDLDGEGTAALAHWMHSLYKNLHSDVYIQNFPPNRLTVDALRAQLMLLKTRDNFVPDLVLLDYMDLMLMPTHIKDLNLQLAWLGVELRALALEANVALITATQTNRGGASAETAKGTDIAGDFTKVATSDFLISLNQTEKEVDEEVARFFWIKNRLGVKHRTYKIQTDFDRSMMSPL